MVQQLCDRHYVLVSMMTALAGIEVPIPISMFIRLVQAVEEAGQDDRWWSNFQKRIEWIHDFAAKVYKIFSDHSWNNNAIDLLPFAMNLADEWSPRNADQTLDCVWSFYEDQNGEIHSEGTFGVINDLECLHQRGFVFIDHQTQTVQLTARASKQ